MSEDLNVILILKRFRGGASRGIFRGGQSRDIFRGGGQLKKTPSKNFWCFELIFSNKQGCRTLQPFVGDKNGHENFRQAHNYNFLDKCIVFARNRKFANLTQ